MAVLIYSQSFSQKTAERKSPKKYLLYFVCLAWRSKPGFTSKTKNGKLFFSLVSHTMLCVFILYMSGETYSLQSTTNDRVLRNFIYSQIFCQKSAERKRPKKYFLFFVRKKEKLEQLDQISGKNSESKYNCHVNVFQKSVVMNRL